MQKKVALHTLGCKLNFSETSTIGDQFLNYGYQIVNFDESADIYLFNTCTVTQNAERECRQLVRRALRNNPDAFVIVTGCYAQLRPEELSQIEGVEAILGNQEKFKLFSLINDFTKKELSCIFVSPTNQLNEFGHAHSTDADSRTRAYLKIQDGCDYKCTFCTIPLARGKSRSMNPDLLVEEFIRLLNQGYKEIILTGVNVGDYGHSFGTNLYQLLVRLTDIPGNFRIRVSSIEPNLLTDELLDLTFSNKKMCKHFHIPLQSGSPDILKQMRRRYTTEYYYNLIEKINSYSDETGIGVDVIVGFPGETENDFLTTYTLLRDLKISYLHVFTYSERPNTPAAEMKNQVDVYERRRRNNMLRILSEKKKEAFYKKMIGKELEVLFETENLQDAMKGFSSNYVRVSTDYGSNSTNQIMNVEITGITEGICEAKISENKNSIDLKAS